MGTAWNPTAGAAKAADAIKSIVVKSKVNKKEVDETGGLGYLISIFRYGVWNSMEFQDDVSRELLESCAGALHNLAIQNEIAQKKLQVASTPVC